MVQCAIVDDDDDAEGESQRDIRIFIVAWAAAAAAAARLIKRNTNAMPFDLFSFLFKLFLIVVIVVFFCFSFQFFLQNGRKVSSGIVKIIRVSVDRPFVVGSGSIASLAIPLTSFFGLIGECCSSCPRSLLRLRLFTFVDLIFGEFLGAITGTHLLMLLLLIGRWTSAASRTRWWRCRKDAVRIIDTFRRIRCRRQRRLFLARGGCSDWWRAAGEPFVPVSFVRIHSFTRIPPVDGATINKYKRANRIYSSVCLTGCLSVCVQCAVVHPTTAPINDQWCACTAETVKETQRHARCCDNVRDILLFNLQHKTQLSCKTGRRAMLCCYIRTRGSGKQSWRKLGHSFSRWKSSPWIPADVYDLCCWWCNVDCPWNLENHLKEKEEGLVYHHFFLSFIFLF